MMNRFFTLLLTASCLTAVGQVDIEYPYNPDFENDGSVGIEDLMSLLSVYGLDFTPEELLVDGASLSEIILALQVQIDSLAAYTDDGIGSLSLSDSTIIEYLIGAVSQSEQADSTLSSWVVELSSVVSSQQSILDSLLAQNSTSGAWSLSCIEFGLGPSCSPHSGLCNEVILGPTEDGKFPISFNCSNNFDPNACWRPTWRRFRLEGPSAADISFLKGERIGNTSTSNGYFSFVDDFSIPFLEVDGGIEFWVWSGESLEGFVGLYIGDSPNGIARWTDTYFSLFMVIDGIVEELPMRLHF